MVAQGEGRSPMTSSDAETDSKPIIIIIIIIYSSQAASRAATPPRVEPQIHGCKISWNLGVGS